MSAPGTSDVKGLASPYTRSVCFERFVEEFGTLCRDLQRHIAIGDWHLGIPAEVPVEERLAAIAQSVLGVIIWTGDKTVQRHGHVEDNFTHDPIFASNHSQVNTDKKDIR